MRIILQLRDEEADFMIGRLRKRYELIDEHGDLVAMIDDTEQAIPLLEARARANPPKWEREGPGYRKLRWFGALLVEPTAVGRWLVYRDYCPLLNKDGSAIFDSLSAAQAAAEIHLYDGYPNAVATNDDFLWSEQSVRPVELGVPQVKPTTITISGTVDGDRLHSPRPYLMPSKLVFVGLPK
jgi:hypothetical protein